MFATMYKGVILKLKQCEELLKATFENIHLEIDTTRQQRDDTTVNKLIDLADLCSQIKPMFSGEAINKTGNRSVLHVVLKNFSMLHSSHDSHHTSPHVTDMNEPQDFELPISNHFFATLDFSPPKTKSVARNVE